MAEAVVGAGGRIAEFRDVDRATFAAKIETRYQPAVMRGAVADWPAVHRARESMQSIAAYLLSPEFVRQVKAFLVKQLERKN
jgi:hypothetical protein